jgi:hypothetical protein
MQYFNTKKESGFAMLFTVLIVTLILSIAVGISNLTFRQAILSSLAKDSQVAFFAADAAVECGLYHDITENIFPSPMPPDMAPKTITCGFRTLTLDDSSSATDYLIYAEKGADPAQYCYSILFDKSSTPGTSIVQGRGYNICSANPRQVERTLETRY